MHFLWVSLASVCFILSVWGDSLDAILDETYDGRVRPGNDGKPLEVKVKLAVEDFENVDDNKQEVTIGFEIQETWHDSRLNQTLDKKLPSVNPLVDDAARVWSPETHFANSKESSLLKNVQKINPDGQVTKLIQARITAYCKMELFYFPFDRHICTFKIVNMEYSIKELIYVWTDTNFLQMDTEVSKTSFFNLAGYRLGNYSSKGLLGNHSGLELQLFLTRKSRRSFPIFYFPAIALSIIAFISLWLPSTLLAIYMSLLSFATMTIFSVLVQNELPKYFEITMLDHYHFLCLNLILNAVIVNILIYGYMDSSKKIPRPSRLQNGKIEMKTINGVHEEGGEEGQSHSEDPEEHIHKLSTFKRFVYFKACKHAKYQLPIGFALINVIYWLWILIASSAFPPTFQKVIHT